MARVALVVDDSMLIRHTVCRFLEERGFAMESATNGKEALEMLETVIPDLIVTDLLMPHMTGHEFIERLRASRHTAEIPVVVLAGRQGWQDIQSNLAVQHVIHKNIEIDAQLEKVLVAVFPDLKSVEKSAE